MSGVGSFDSRACVAQHGLRGLQLGLEEVALGGDLHQLEHRVGQLGRQRHLAAAPDRHYALVARGLAHIGDHVLGAHVLQHAASEHEAVALVEPRDEAFLDVADAGSVTAWRQALVSASGAASAAPARDDCKQSNVRAKRGWGAHAVAQATRLLLERPSNRVLSTPPTRQATVGLLRRAERALGRLRSPR